MTSSRTASRATKMSPARQATGGRARRARLSAWLLRALRPGHLVALEVGSMDPRKRPRAVSGHLLVCLIEPGLDRSPLGVSGGPGAGVRAGGRGGNDLDGGSGRVRRGLDRDDGSRPRLAALGGRRLLASRTGPDGHAFRSPARDLLARVPCLLPGRTPACRATPNTRLVLAVFPGLVGQHARPFRIRPDRSGLLPCRTS